MLPPSTRWFLRVCLAVTLASPLFVLTLAIGLEGAVSPALMALQILGASIGALAAVTLLEYLASPLAPAARRLIARAGPAGAARPRAAIVVAAAIGTAAAMYPVVFLGESLVSPNNGGVALLYNRAPFTPGQTDPIVEDVRNNDTGAGMWAFVPYSVVQREAIRQGEFPMWNRYNGAGRPLLGQGQSLIFDPLHWLVLLAPDVALGWDLDFAAHRLVFATGTGLAVRALTGSWTAAAAMAAMAPFAAYYVFRLNHPAQFALSYAPFVLLGWLRMQRAQLRRELAAASAMLAAATALVIAGSPPKEAMVMLLCCHAAGALACLLAPRDWRSLARQLAAAAAAGIVALLITAPQWLVFLDTMRHMVTAYDTPSARFAPWPAVVAWAVGSLFPGVLSPGVHAAAIAAWCASIAGGRATWQRPETIAATLAPVLPLLVAVGTIPEPLILRIPLLANIVQIDYAFLTAAVALLFVAAGPGAALVLSGRSRPAVAAMSLATIAIAWGLGGAATLTQSVDAWKPLIACGLGILLIPAAAAAARFWPEPLPVAATVMLLGAIAAPNGLHAWTGVTRLDNGLMQPRARPIYGVDSPSLAALRREQREPSRAIGEGELLLPGSQALYRLEGIGGPDALQPPWVEELIAAGGVTRVWWWRPVVATTDLPAIAPVLDLFGVRFFIADAGHAAPMKALATDGPDPVGVVERSTSWPRAYFVDRASAYGTLAELVEQLRATARPLAMIDLHDAPAASAIGAVDAARAAAGANLPSPPIPADRYELSVNTTRFHITAPGPGIVVLAETWMPGDFVATVDGRRVPYFRVNHAFKAVTVPAAGGYEIAFTYWPARLGRALVMAAAGLAGLTILILMSRQR